MTLVKIVHAKMCKELEWKERKMKGEGRRRDQEEGGVDQWSEYDLKRSSVERL